VIGCAGASSGGNPEWLPRLAITMLDMHQLFDEANLDPNPILWTYGSRP